MAVEIKEIVIRAVVDYPSQAKHAANDQQQTQMERLPVDQEAIVQACVKQVLKVLRRTKNR